ncbi:hypothetical protein Zmor_003540 [Zophobas morio]|uniref:Uncharacterized protein n=1 Tax=Zophobas morio TaxID=2755281 RepID=A0AA38HPD7_9CUCU|nr:hypothetical protein Zmor_003540 [Zophobas morio]
MNFQTGCFARRVLKTTAIPTQNLPKAGERDIEHMMKQKENRLKRLNHRRQIQEELVENETTMRTRRDNLEVTAELEAAATLMQFSVASSSHSQEVLEELNQSSSFNQTISEKCVSATRMCSLHFAAQCFYKSLQHRLLEYSPKCRRRLMPNAIPTKNGFNKSKLSPSPKGCTQIQHIVETASPTNYKIQTMSSHIISPKRCGRNLFGDDVKPLQEVATFDWQAKHSSAAISINKNCEKDDDESLLTPLEEKEICLTESLFSSIIDTKCVLPSNEDSHLVKLQFVDTDTHHFSEVEVEVDVEDNKISTEGLRYVAGYVAHRFRHKYPHLGTPAENVPHSFEADWIQFLSRGNLLQPSSDLLHAAELLETLFLTFHGTQINKQPYIIKYLVQQLKRHLPENMLADEVYHCLVRTRTFIRIRELNKRSFYANLKRQNKRKIKKICGK